MADDRPSLSRRLIQALDADEAISVAARAPALDVAQRAHHASRRDYLRRSAARNGSVSAGVTAAA